MAFDDTTQGVKRNQRVGGFNLLNLPSFSHDPEVTPPTRKKTAGLPGWVK
uniref:Uncharacterized protein n=1 Tax=Anguilla anguilla TaxID=7936 RepID=A0A0E9UAV1_ANGAN